MRPEKEFIFGIAIKFIKQCKILKVLSISKTEIIFQKGHLDDYRKKIVFSGGDYIGGINIRKDGIGRMGAPGGYVMNKILKRGDGRDVSNLPAGFISC